MISPRAKIDLITINTVNPKGGVRALEYSQKYFKFNRTILFSHKNPANNKFEFIETPKFIDLTDYSNFILRLKNIINSDYILIVQEDGFIINPNNWDDKFLDYDYIGAPWPTSRKWLRRWDNFGKDVSSKISKNIKHNNVGNGGFSLRSRKFLEYSSIFDDCMGLSEDIFLSLYNFDIAKEYGIKFAPKRDALKFSSETPLGKILYNREKKNGVIDVNKHFGWHGKKFKNSEALINLKSQPE